MIYFWKFQMTHTFNQSLLTGKFHVLSKKLAFWKKKTKNILVQLFKTNQYTYFQIGFLDNNIFQILIHNLHELAAGSVPRSAQTRVTAEFLTKSKYKRKCTIKSILNTIKITIILLFQWYLEVINEGLKNLFISYKTTNYKLINISTGSQNPFKAIPAKISLPRMLSFS